MDEKKKEGRSQKREAKKRDACEQLIQQVSKQGKQAEKETQQNGKRFKVQPEKKEGGK